ncbi:protein kinase superfamily protein, partial [Striga asiatica]
AKTLSNLSAILHRFSPSPLPSNVLFTEHLGPSFNCPPRLKGDQDTIRPPSGPPSDFVKVAVKVFMHEYLPVDLGSSKEPKIKHKQLNPFRVKDDKNLSKRNKGTYTFRVQGQVYHFINNLSDSKNLQLYFYDTDNEVANRLNICPRLNESIIEKVIKILSESSYARFFSFKNNNEHGSKISQVAAIWIEVDENEETGRRDIQIQSCIGSSHNIEYYYGCYDPLQYPLLFAYGEVGRHQGILKKGENHTSTYHHDKNSENEISPLFASIAEELLESEHQ